MEKSEVRVRFAPAPTGYLHVGGARTALYNWLFARNKGGKFVLRVEDTDRERSTPEATEDILESLKWMGLDWDEGPVFQSAHLEDYTRASRALLEKKLAYEEVTEKGTAIRFRPPREAIVMDDLIHGLIRFEGDILEDFVIMKSDGFPTYNFACVVDDVAMNITHVIRGDDHISNTPRQITLYKALGGALPRFAHIPMILGEDGSRLSKRHGATSVAEYRRKGFLSEAMVNFLALLGWSPGENVEIMSRDELVAKFSLERVNKTSAQFNAQKLLWMNGHYIRSTALERLAALTKEYLAGEKVDLAGLDDDWILKLVRLYRERMKTLKDILDDGYHFFTEDIRYEETSVGEHLSGKGPILLRSALTALRELPDFDASTLDRALRDLCAKESVGLARVAQPIRVAVTGRHTSPPIFETLELLGKERTVGRIERTLSMLDAGTLAPKAPSPSMHSGPEHVEGLPRGSKG